MSVHFDRRVEEMTNRRGRTRARTLVAEALDRVLLAQRIPLGRPHTVLGSLLLSAWNFGLPYRGYHA